MSFFFWTVFYATAFAGHAAFWIGLFNRSHGTRLNNRIIRKSSYLVVATGIFCLPLLYYRFGPNLPNGWPASWEMLQGFAGLYLWFSVVVFVYTLSKWLYRQLDRRRTSPKILRQQSNYLDFTPDILRAKRNRVEKFFAAVPGNQIYHCVVEEREILMDSISDSIDGFTITHLSDFHFTGNICREYFHSLVSTANGLQSDVIVITGDIIDSPKCWAWIENPLGLLKARFGIYYILGNHDQRTGNESALRSKLDHLGMTPVANTWCRIGVGNSSVHVAGNELPWFGSEMTIASKPEGYQAGDCRILLSHSPDQWHWACQNGFDLMLAGHTHGGQIRVPGIGPIVCPSRYGVKYASGIFTAGPQVMVVSRGVSGEEPVRLHCPPEIGKITLRCKS